jgi:hypothetical protein
MVSSSVRSETRIKSEADTSSMITKSAPSPVLTKISSPGGT